MCDGINKAIQKKSRFVNLMHSNFYKAVCILLALSIGMVYLPEKTVKAVSAMNFYVAVNGNDTWSGNLEAPNVDGTDGPFATIERARDAIRSMKQSGGLTAPVNVIIRGGRYDLSSPLVIEGQDSGTAEFPVTYMSYPGEKPVISGGKQITGFSQDSTYPDLWSVAIPEVSSGTWYFNSLFVDGKRATRARSALPWYHVAGSGSATGSFKYNGDEIQNYQNLDDVVITTYNSWEVSKHHVTSVDESTRTVTIDGAPAGNNQRYVVENAFELLDTPGEWYLNRDSGKLYYYPKQGEDMTNATVIAPVLTRTMIRLNGTSAQNVQFINFDGISFKYTDPYLPHTGDFASIIYGAVYQEAAIMGDYVNSCSFSSCEFAHIGEYALWLRDGANNNTIKQSKFHDLGAGGIRIAKIDMPAASENNGNNVIDNNFIYDDGHVFPGGVGIWVGVCSSGNKISHNEICDLTYSGVALGWFNSSQDRGSFNNIIEYNNIHNIFNGILSDGAGIYTLGNSRGTIIRNNLIHDSYSYSTEVGGNGIYLDETSANITVENNISYNTINGFFSNNGSGNIVRNNIFAYPESSGIKTGIANKAGIAFDFNHNIIYGGNIIYTRNTEPFLFTSDFNVLFDIKNRELYFNGRNIASWHALGNDVNSSVSDPLFRNPLEYDFALQEGSPALGMGFQQIDVSTAGLYGDQSWTGLPAQIYPEKEIASVNSENITVYEGNVPSLPDTVSVTYTDNTTASVPVVWDSVDPSAFSDAGSVSVHGNIGFTAIRAQANVSVVEGSSSQEVNFVTGVIPAQIRADYTGWVGMRMTVGASPITVTRLGRWVSAGNSGTHTVKLVKASDYSDIPGGAVEINTSGATPGQFKYAALSGPVTLAAGESYYLVSFERHSGDLWCDAGSKTTATDVATVDFPVYYANEWSPDTRTWENTSFVPVNLTYESNAAIPASSFVNAETGADDGKVIKVKFSKPMANPQTGATGFAVTYGDSNTDAAISSVITDPGDNTVLDVILSDSLTIGTLNIRVSYTKGTVLAADGGILESFTSQNVNNKIEAAPPTLLEAKTSADGNSVMLTFDKQLSALPASPAGFSVTEGTNNDAIEITDVQLNAQDARKIEIKLADALLYITNATVSYTPGSVETITGGLLANFTQEVTNTIPAPKTNIVANPDFESGSSPWSKTGDGVSFSLDSDVYHSAGNSGKAAGRTVYWHGPVQNITGVLNNSGQGTYDFSAWTRLGTGSDQVVMALSLTDDNGTTYPWVAQGNANASEFIEISGKKNITWNGTLQSAQVQFFTYNNSGSHNLSPLYIDDVSIVKEVADPVVTGITLNDTGSKVMVALNKPIAAVPEAPGGFSLTKGVGGENVDVSSIRVSAADHRIMVLTLAQPVPVTISDLMLSYTAVGDGYNAITATDNSTLKSFAALIVENPQAFTPGGNVVNDPGFENGGVSWSANEGDFSIDITSKHSGNNSGKNSNRINWWDGPGQDIAQKLTQSGPGEYNLSAWAKLGSGTGRVQFFLSINNGAKFMWLPSGAADSNGFAEIKGKVNIDSTTGVNTAILYATTYDGGGTYNLSDLYIDDVSFYKTAIQSINPVNVTTTAGTAPVLPSTITAVYNDATTTGAAVTWDSIDVSDYAQPGSFTVHGTVAGTAIKATANVTVNAAEPQAPIIVSINPVNVSTTEGTAPVLPSTVTVVYSDTTTTGAAVTWDSIDASNYAQPGSFTVQGTVAGTAIKATANVTVNAAEPQVPTIVSINPVNVTTTEGNAPVLPSTVTAVYSDATITGAAVTWDSIDDSAYAQPGSFTVQGTVAGTAIKATANVTVSAMPAPTPTPTPAPTPAPVVTKEGNTTTATAVINASVDTASETATVNINANWVAALAEKAKEAEASGQKAIVQIKVEAATNVKAVEVEIPKESLKQIADNTKAEVKVDAGIGSISFSEKAVDAISGAAAAGDISIGIKKVEKASLSEAVQTKVGDRPIYDFSVKAGNTQISNFNGGRVEIEIPYTPKAGEKKNSIIVYYIDSKGKLKTVLGNYDAASGMVKFTTTHFSKYAVGYNEVNFTDVAGSARYSEAVQFIAARGITNGVGNGRFAPESKVTRADFLVMVMKAYGIEVDTVVTDNFSDAGDKYYTRYLGTAKKLGLVDGVGGNRFSPETSISRQDVIVILYNILGKLGELPANTGEKSLTGYKDHDQIAGYAKNAMELFVNSGTVTGSDSRIMPKAETTREQIARILYNLLSK